MFDKVLIANRGAIAVRIERTLKKMGIGSVAVYSKADQDSLHVERADEAVYIGDGTAKETYLDDFGTGYSNFDRILSLKLDVVKFDRSLLLMANKDENSQFILNYFSTAFKKLGYKVLYEGVETDEQETICVNSHADYLQGFKFSKPIPIEELKNFLSPIQE